MRQLSSIAEDVWHTRDAARDAYEWWYFDAVSDDGRDAVVVIFLANFVFSPRYNRAASAHARARVGAAADVAAADTRRQRFPAVVFCLYRDGRPLLRSINEYDAEEFGARTDNPSCRIGRSSFRFEGSEGRQHPPRFVLEIDETYRRQRALSARLEWSVLEGDLSSRVERTSASLTDGHIWNMVAPRCRVEGSVRVAAAAQGGAPVFEQRFTGTGYHDHNCDRRWMPSTIDEWQWGRAHFRDMTVVFYRYSERGQLHAPATRLFLVRGGSLTETAATLSARDTRRQRFGLLYPQLLHFETEPGAAIGATLDVRQQHIVDASYFYLRFLGEATLRTADGRTATAPIISEHLAPRALGWRWLDWLTDMRIGRGGRSSLLS